VKIGGSLKVIGAGISWRRLGHAGSGRRLLQAVGGDDEQDRLLAGMALVRAGERSIGLIESAIQAGTAPTQAVQILADIGGERARSVLVSTAASETGLESAAIEALDLLDRIARLEDDR